MFADIFAEGDKVDVTGISKGKGYAGIIKRWNAHSQEHTHGVGPVHRSRRFHGRQHRPLQSLPGQENGRPLGL